MERNESVKSVNVYYRAPGNQKTIKAMLKGLQLLAPEQGYHCNDGPLRDTAPYGCNGRWSTSVDFPDCINTSRLANEATNAVYSRTGVCPSTHPYRIPRINFLVMHNGGSVPNPLRVSAGADEWHDYTFMHADYFSANRPVFNRDLPDLCLREALDRVTFASRRCGE